MNRGGINFQLPSILGILDTFFKTSASWESKNKNKNKGEKESQ
jgi:hypothetical protein